MIRLLLPMLAWLSLMICASTVRADPKIEEVFQGISGSLSKPTDMSKVLGLVLACAGLVGVLIAIRYMQQKSDPNRPLHHHKKLMREVSAQSGLSKRTLSALEPLTKAEGLSNPLVALLCPSALKSLSKKVKTPAEKEALLDAARHIARANAQNPSAQSRARSR